MLSIVLMLLSPFTILFDRQKSILHYLTSLWGYHFVLLNPFWQCRFEGTDYLKCGQSYVIVANHQSLADVFVLSGLKHHFKWVSKDSLFRIPFFGWNMRLNEYVAVKRGNANSIREMMSSCKKWLSQGVSIMMFPEGTRSENGRMSDFRDGSFRLSLDSNVPLVPVVITGTREVLAKHSFIFNLSAKMTIKILPPILPGPFQGSPGRMRDHVHELMERTLYGLRQGRDHMLPETDAALVPTARGQTNE